MNILAIDSSTEVCSVAVGNGIDVFQVENRSRSGHSQTILDLVSNVLDIGEVTLSDLDLIAVDVGPGSFTGLRIGIGVAKGIAYAGRLPLAGITSLEILSRQCQSGIVMPALDARMGEVYTAVFEVGADSRPNLDGAMRVVKPEDSDIPRDCPVIGLGSGWDNYGEAMLSIDQENVSILGNRLPQARDLLHLAQLTNPQDWVTAVELEAAYIRDRVVQLPAASAGN